MKNSMSLEECCKMPLHGAIDKTGRPMRLGQFPDGDFSFSPVVPQYEAKELKCDFICDQVLREYVLTAEEKRQIKGKVQDLLEEINGRDNFGTGEKMDFHTSWQLYLGLCFVAAAILGVSLILHVRRRKDGCRHVESNRAHHMETIPPPNAAGVDIPASPEWCAMRDFLQQKCSGSFFGNTLYLTRETIAKLHAYNKWTPRFVEAICRFSNGSLEPIWPKVGDIFDPVTMDENDHLTSTSHVTAVLGLGLRQKETGKIVQKAFVTVR